MVSAHSLVITIDLVSILSRGAAFAGDLGFSNETCGQTRHGPISRDPKVSRELILHTTSMTTCFRIIHHKRK